MSNMMPQHGGKYGDHEFVKVASKVIKGVERAPYTKFETILVNYDKMKDIKEKRNLTKTEQRIYDQADKLIKKEFDAMFKKADTMLDQLDQKTPDQKGGGGRSNILSKINPFKSGNKVSPDPDATTPATKDTEEVPQPAPAAATSDAPASADPASTAAADTKEGTSSVAASAAGPPSDDSSKAATSSSDAASKEDPAIKRMREDSTVSNASVTVPESKELPSAKDKPFHPRDGENNDDPAPPAPAPPAAPKGPDNETSYMDSNRFYRWIVSLLKGIWEWIKGLFTGAFSDKFEQLRKQFSADELFKLFGEDLKKMDAATDALRVQAEKIQRLVATGIGGAASASIDMILNAFSMSPVFGTTILVWRMFQNMLMIMGASLSVQAASNSTSTAMATIANPKLAKEPPTQQGGGRAKVNAKNNVTKRIKTDIRQLNRSLKRYMHFPHRHRHRQQGQGTMSGAGSGYSYT